MNKTLPIFLILLLFISCNSAPDISNSSSSRESTETSKESLLDLSNYSIFYKDYSITIDGNSDDWADITPTISDTSNDSKYETDMKAIYSFVSNDQIFYYMAESYNDFIMENSTIEIKSTILYKNGDTKELGFNIRTDHTYGCWIDGEEIQIPGLIFSWSEVLEFSLPVFFIRDAVGIEVTFTNLWIHTEDYDGWVDIVGQ